MDETMLGRSIVHTAGLTPRSGAIRQFAPGIRFGGPRVFNLWEGSSKGHPPEVERTALRRRMHRAPEYYPDPTEVLGLDREVDE